MDRREFVTWHTSAPWRVVFTGFAPGFGYLTSPAHTVSIPRLAEPRTTVPPGSIAMAGEFTGIYPRESPGGWQIVGRTEEVLFDLHQDPPALLVPGRPVRFVEVS
jgi:KipI family sensor histidine kinase inhibitor